MLRNVIELYIYIFCVAYQCHVIRWNTMSKTLLQGTIGGKRKRVKPKMQWQDNIVEWTGLGLEEVMLKTKNREGWKKIVKK